jgi:hypothetical protein
MTSPIKGVLLFLFTSQILFAQNTEIKYLSGTDNENTVQWDFQCSKGRNSGMWKKIAVPSCWELQGFGTYNYGWEENYKENEIGLYRISFSREKTWKNKIARLVFEGSMTDTEVKVNGKTAGPVHQGSFYEFKYDVTKLLKETNTLEVKVSKISSDTSVNRAERMSDYWVFGGIYRPVYLEILPPTFIDRIAIDAKADGTFRAEVYSVNATKGLTLESQIETLQGEPVGKPFSLPLQAGAKSILQSKIDQPALWSPEYPNLYQVVVRLKKGQEVLHQVKEKFGFRTVEFREGDGFYINDAKVMFKGVNRHSFWPTSGRTTNKKISILDVNLMKEMNMNAVRMSHYPPDKHFLDVCDSVGLFVLDELGGWQKKYDTGVGKKLLREMVIRDVNHPSIVIWDNGNEGGNNHELVGEFAIHDPQKRKVIHPWNVFQGTDTQHYKGYNCCAGSLYQGNNVFFPTEIIHGLYDGGNGAGLSDHWKLMRENPLSAGCFLWCFADEGIVRHDRGDSVDIKGNRAPDGIGGPFREKEGSFYAIKEIWSPVQIKTKLITKDFDGIFEVENNYLYTNLDEVIFSWIYSKSMLPGDASIRSEILKWGNFKGPHVVPGKTGTLNVPVPPEFKHADVLYLTATDRYKKEIFTWSWALKTPKEINQTIGMPGKGKSSVTENNETVELFSGDIRISINKKSGLIDKVSNAGRTISLSNGPVLAAGTSELETLKHFQNGNDYVVEVFSKGNLKKLQYTLLSSGILKIHYAYSHYNWNSRNEFDFLGVNFNYPEKKITGIKYFGTGPYRVWKNRLKGGRLNVWAKKYNNTITGESWDYPEFKGYYKDFKWVVIQNTESPFTIYTETENLFLRLYTPQKPRGAGNDYTSPPFPAGDISFLHGITPIGTKFDGAENHGPEGQKNKVGTEWITATLYFDFR